MKKNILAIAILTLTLYSCDNASGGNKNIIPVDPSTQSADSAHANHSAQNHEAHGTEKNMDSTHTEKQQPAKDSISVHQGH
ncbi:hypothetical protein [Apibacter sp. HY039]|uniref:hypothetical protein n=1 Tax=Apibacter sp. HY039 TaxID=2501476 RepID=UPI000FEBE3EA|nr:hypothetical protein [Apibacter sp. HY039]